MKRIAIVSTNKFKYSETFIHAQVKGLLFQKWLLHGGYFPVLWSEGLVEEDHPLGGEKGWQFWRENGKTAALARWLKRQKIDLVLAQYGPSGVAVLEACEKAGIPLLTHFHGYDAYRSDILEEQGQHYPELFRRSAGQIVVSQAMQQQLLNLGASAERLHLIPYGIDLEQFQVSDPEKARRTLLAVGRFTAKKAPQLLIRAFAQAYKVVPHAQLLLVGEGELRPQVEAEIDRWKLQEAVQLLGRKSPVEVAKLLQSARAFVQHSLVPESGDSEGLPLSILEAMACGLPIVATRHAGIPEAVREGKEGLLSAEGEVLAMAQNMELFLKDQKAASQMGKNGRQRVEAHYSVGRYLGQLSALIQEVLGS